MDSLQLKMLYVTYAIVILYMESITHSGAVYSVLLTTMFFFKTWTSLEYTIIIII